MRNSEAANVKNWQDYQRKLKRTSRFKRLLARMPVLGLYGVLTFLLISGTFLSGSWLYAHFNEIKTSSGIKVYTEPEEAKRPEPLTPSRLSALIKPFDPLSGFEENRFAFEADGRILRAETTLDMDLQAYTAGLLQKSLTHRAAVVAVNPLDGRILAMVSYPGPESGVTENLCLKAEFPAASLIKIVAAAAAIEARDFDPEKTLRYKGRRYTLYKKQLKEIKTADRYTNEISFKKAFSSSINPVFGKIGIFHLGQEILRDYAERFLFNTPIPLDLPLELSRIDVPSDSFGLAEIASGFNKRTLISPLHASLIAAAVANDGVMMSPWMIKRVTEESGEQVYLADIRELAVPIEKKTALIMKTLMEDTVRHGTCRTAFGKLKRKKEFQNIDLGAKTGTVNDREDRYKFDWITTYVLPRDERPPICLTVLAVHGEKLGIRAKDLARYILDHKY